MGLCRVWGTKPGSEHSPHPARHERRSWAAGLRWRGGHGGPPNPQPPWVGGRGQPQAARGHRGAALAPPGHKCDEQAGLSLPSSGEQPRSLPPTPPRSILCCPHAHEERDQYGHEAKHPRHSIARSPSAKVATTAPSKGQGGPRSSKAEEEVGSAELGRGQELQGSCRKGIKSFVPTTIRLITPSSLLAASKSPWHPAKRGSIRPGTTKERLRALGQVHRRYHSAVPHGTQLHVAQWPCSPVASLGGADVTKPGWVRNPGRFLDVRAVRSWNCLPEREQKPHLLSRGWSFITQGLHHASAKRNRALPVRQV